MTFIYFVFSVAESLQTADLVQEMNPVRNLTTYERSIAHVSEVDSWTAQRLISVPLRGSLFSTSQRSVLLALLEFVEVLDLSEVIFADLSEVGFRPRIVSGTPQLLNPILL